MDFARELGSKLADCSDTVLSETRQVIREELNGLSRSVSDIVRREIDNALQNKTIDRKPRLPPNRQGIADYVPPSSPSSY